MKDQNRKAMFAKKKDFFVSSSMPKVTNAERTFHRVTAESENDARRIFTKNSREPASSPKVVSPDKVKEKFRKFNFLGNPKVQLN